MSGEPRIPRAASALNGDKAALRAELLALRCAVTPEAKASMDAAIGARVLDWCQAAGFTSLGVYWPLRGEPDLQAAYTALAARGVQLMLPVVVDAAAPLAFSLWTPGEAMLKDRMGVAVPEQLRLGALPDALLIPCVGFNADAYRLGYGGGFYDRTLAGPLRPATAGVAYARLLADFASAPHDVALDCILTE